jgi:putative flippase GtrA
VLSKSSLTRENLARLPWKAIARWWITGGSFVLIGLATLYLVIDVFRMPMLWGTLVAAEATTLLRFVINDRWVFGNGRPTWRRLGQFHLANAGGFVIWWAVINILPKWGVQYLIASVAGTACSVVVSMATNFLWIWRKQVNPTTSQVRAASATEAVDAG